MRVAEINMCSYGSTGNIMFAIAKKVRSCGGEARTYSTYSFSYHKTIEKKMENHYYYGSQFSSDVHYILGRISSLNGVFSVAATYDLIKKLKAFKPDILHLHNLHNFCINLPMLFNYIKRERLTVVWTLHDCWAFTGHCAHFLLSNCSKWQTGCYDCPSYKNYPKTEFDSSKIMYVLKKKWFTGVERLKIVTPSEWLARMVSLSFLNEYPLVVINNGIDLGRFYKKDSDFRKVYNIEDKTILLGVSFNWGYNKGIDYFVRLSNDLPKEYSIVLCGVTKEEKKELPENIICIEKTNNIEELAGLYSCADIFINPTREDTFPTVNIEALACGTPVITLNTGGSPEIIDSTCGIICNNYNDILKSILTFDKNQYKSESCRKRAMHFSSDQKYQEYVELFNEMIMES